MGTSGAAPMWSRDDILDFLEDAAHNIKNLVLGIAYLGIIAFTLASLFEYLQ